MASKVMNNKNGIRMVRRLLMTACSQNEMSKVMTVRERTVTNGT